MWRILLVMAAGWAQTAYAEPQAAFKRTWFPVGKYLVLNGTTYLTKGAENVSRPGQMGVLTGRRGLSGTLIQNGFANVTTLSDVKSGNGWIFEIDSKSLAKVNAGGSVSGGEEIENLDLDLQAGGARNRNANEAYKGVLLYAADWVAIDRKIDALWKSNTASNYLTDEDFRVVDAVLYATGYKGDQQIRMDGSATFNANGGSTVGSVNVTAEADTSKTYSISLADQSVIAFSSRHLCWRNGNFAGTAPDVIGAKRPKNCPAYQP